jgi:hypothetical protein
MRELTADELDVVSGGWGQHLVKVIKVIKEKEDRDFKVKFDKEDKDFKAKFDKEDFDKDDRDFKVKFDKEDKH